MLVDQIVEQGQCEQRNDSGDQVSGPVDVDPDVERIGPKVVDAYHGGPDRFFGV